MAHNLVGDIGGTWARLAVMDSTGAIRARRQVPVTDFGDPARACAAFLAETGHRVDAVALAGAGPRVAGRITLTNAAVAIDPEAIRDATGASRALLLNDLEAAAWGLDADRIPDGESKTAKPNHAVLISLGTGLGVAQRLFDPPAVLPGEAGHARLFPETEADETLFQTLRARHPELSVGDGLAIEAEAVLCGAGLVRLFGALGGGPGTTTANIAALARQGEPTARDALHRFGALLGGFAGDLALLAGDRGCLVLTGGFLDAVPEILGPEFRRALTSGGRFSAHRAACPFHHLPDPDLGLRGAWQVLVMRA